jgi:hypothetical protein
MVGFGVWHCPTSVRSRALIDELFVAGLVCEGVLCILVRRVTPRRLVRHPLGGTRNESEQEMTL